MSEPDNTPTDWPAISELELARLAAAVNPSACRKEPKVAINQALRLLTACRDFLAQSYAQRLSSQLREGWFVILTTEPDDSARAWLRQHAKNAEDRFTNAVNLVNALKAEKIELIPANEAVALERIRWALGEDAFKARFSESAWAEYWQEHNARPRIYPVERAQLEELLKARRAKRTEKRHKTRLTRR